MADDLQRVSADELRLLQAFRQCSAAYRGMISNFAQAAMQQSHKKTPLPQNVIRLAERNSHG